MLTAITLENFKSYQRARLSLAPLTVLIGAAISNLKCNTLTEGNVRKWERDTNTCSQKTE